MYKIDQRLVELGYQGPDAYLKDENGSPVPETIRKLDPKAMRFLLKWYRPERWGKRRKIDALREGGVLVIGEIRSANTIRPQASKPEGGRRVRE